MRCLLTYHLFYIVAIFWVGACSAQAPLTNWTIEGAGTGYDVAIDDNGNVYTMGVFVGTDDFDPGLGVYELTCFGETDIFVTKVDSDGNFLWADRIGGTGIDHGYGVAVHPTGNCFVTGFYSEEMTVGATTLTNAGDFDVYLVRYGNESITSLSPLFDPQPESKEIGRYNILGQPIDRNHSGLQVILFEDGTRQKVLPIKR